MTVLVAYKVLSGPQMAELESGSFVGAPVDQADGYIHLSTADQLTETVDKHFAGQDDLHVAAEPAQLHWRKNRVDSAADIVALMQSEGGARLLQDPAEKSSGGGFRDQVIRTAQIAVVLLLASGGLFVLAWLNAFDARSSLIAFAVMAAFIGVGFALSAALAWRLGKWSGLTESAAQPRDSAAAGREP